MLVVLPNFTHIYSPFNCPLKNQKSEEMQRNIKVALLLGVKHGVVSLLKKKETDQVVPCGRTKSIPKQ